MPVTSGDLVKGSAMLHQLTRRGRWAATDTRAGVPIRHAAWRARSTTLKSAPPLAKLLTSAMGPDAAAGSRARHSGAAAGSGSSRPAIGGTRPLAPHRSAAAHEAVGGDVPADHESEVTPGGVGVGAVGRDGGMVHARSAAQSRGDMTAAGTIAPSSGPGW